VDTGNASPYTTQIYESAPAGAADGWVVGV